MRTVIVAIVFSAFPVFLPAQTHHGYGGPKLGNVSQVQALRSCPAGFSPGAQCSQATVSCPNTADIQVTYGVQQGSGTKGTVVMVSGSGGTLPFNGAVVPLYTEAGYSLITFAWSSDWQDTGLAAKNIATAACRPATLLNYLLQNGRGAKCAHGDSGGAAAIGYALAWYGASSYLDKVQLVSGPVFSDVEQGCEVPPPPPMTVCPAGQFGCERGDTFQDTLSYDSAAAMYAQQITGQTGCAGNARTSSASNTAWKAMSIVDGTTQRSFSYPKTALSGWVCDNGINNSAAEGNIFFQQFTSSSQIANLLLVPVSNCTGAEDVDTGFTPNGMFVPTAMLNDMTDPVNGCMVRH